MASSSSNTIINNENEDPSSSPQQQTTPTPLTQAHLSFLQRLDVISKSDQVKNLNERVEKTRDHFRKQHMRCYGDRLDDIIKDVETNQMIIDDVRALFKEYKLAGFNEEALFTGNKKANQRAWYPPIFQHGHDTWRRHRRLARCKNLQEVAKRNECNTDLIERWDEVLDCEKAPPEKRASKPRVTVTELRAEIQRLEEMIKQLRMENAGLQNGGGTELEKAMEELRQSRLDLDVEIEKRDRIIQGLKRDLHDTCVELDEAKRMAKRQCVDVGTMTMTSDEEEVNIPRGGGGKDLTVAWALWQQKHRTRS